MSAPARRLRRNPLPEGTISVGVGLVVAGLCQYGFLAIAAHALGPDRYAPLATFWALLFVCGPGFFLPLEQEVGRALAARRAHGQGGRPLVARAAVAGGALAAVLTVIVLAAAGPLDSRVFHGDPVLLVGLMAGLAMFFAQFLARGTLAGNQRFRPYGVLLGVEGILRVLICAGLGFLGVTTAGAYGLALVAGSVIAVSLAVAGRRGLLRPGPSAAWSELSNALGFLLLASVITQFLLSIGTVAVQLLATQAQQAAAGRFLTSRIIAYIPIFLLQAIQAALLPKLSALAAAGKHLEFRKMLLELLLLVIVLGGLAVVALTALGPLATRILFGSGFELGTLDFALLSSSCAGFMIAQVLNQALISLTGYARVATAWVAGGVAFVVVTALGSQLFLRVELGLLCGAVVTVAVMVVLLMPLLRARAATVDAQSLLASAPPIAEV